MSKRREGLKRFTAKACALAKRNEGVGLGEILGIAAVLIIAAFVIIPGLRSFAANIMTQLGNWWNNTIAGEIFPSN